MAVTLPPVSMLQDAVETGANPPAHLLPQQKAVWELLRNKAYLYDNYAFAPIPDDPEEATELCELFSNIPKVAGDWWVGEMYGCVIAGAFPHFIGPCGVLGEVTPCIATETATGFAALLRVETEIRLWFEYVDFSEPVRCTYGPGFVKFEAASHWQTSGDLRKTVVENLDSFGPDPARMAGGWRSWRGAEDAEGNPFSYSGLDFRSKEEALKAFEGAKADGTLFSRHFIRIMNQLRDPMEGVIEGG